MKSAEEYALNNKCPSCGSSIIYNIIAKKWICNFCRNSYSLEDLQKYNNASSSKNNAETEEKTNYISYKCQTCGAEIVTDENTVSTFCVYCRNNAIIKSKLSGDFRPSNIIPFQKTKEEAINAFKKVLKGKPLAPRDFSQESNISKIQGIYIPFWLYDIKCSGQITCDCTKIRTWYSGSYQYTQTKKYKVIRDGEVCFKHIPVDGSEHFDNALMNSIEPFNYTEMVDYNHAYLAGFLAEKYDVDSTNAITDAYLRASNSTKDTLLTSINGYSSKIVTSENIIPEKFAEKYVMLPVWLLNINYKGKMYPFAMNGQTGKFIGNIPLCKKQMFILSTVIFVTSFVIFLIISYLIYKGGLS